MASQRAGYAVTIFCIDVSPSMGHTRTVELPDGPDGQVRQMEMTHLEWSLQFAMLKIQEMIFNGRKTDKCGVIIFGSPGTANCINKSDGGYDHVTEYIPIDQPNAQTLSKLAALRPSEETIGDPIDAIIVGIETQDRYLTKKKTWTRKVVLLTDGENPIEIEDWKATVEKIKELNVTLTIVGVDFDDEELPFHQEDKPHIKKENEDFFHTFVDALPENAIMGTLSLALQEVARPDINQTRSVLMGTTLRLGDPDNDPENSLEIMIKTSKCTAQARPKGWKRFAMREGVEVPIEDEDEEMDGIPKLKRRVWAELKMRTEYVVDTSEKKPELETDEEDHMDVDKDEGKKELQKVEKEDLVKGFKYGSTYVPCPDGQFERLPTKKGVEICAFIREDKFRRDYPMGEVQYVWADPASPAQQVALSSLVQAMLHGKHRMMAVARWVNRDGSDPKMGVLSACEFEKVDCLLWVQMPFADDLRKYTFPPLENLINKKGERVTKHPYIPTDDQLAVMDKFVDAMDLMTAGEKNEEGKREAWFDTRLSFNPAIHRTKQALFHSAVVQDLTVNPLPPPHPELIKYFEPPRRVLKKAQGSIEECKAAFKVKEVPKRIPKARKDGHVYARPDEDEEALLLDRVKLPTSPRKPRTQSQLLSQHGILSPTQHRTTQVSLKKDDNDSVTESESEEEDAQMLLDTAKPAGKGAGKLPTPEESPEPETDPGRAPGRIVGTTAPLRDFEKNVARGDVVSKAVEDLGWAVKEVVMRPFAGRRTGEMMECLRALRKLCSVEDEIDAWNSIMKDLKAACLSDPGNPDFWEELRKQGKGLGLISKSEAKKLGGSSDISDAAAAAFLGR